jgi:SNF2 family DNA or RNA helicase
MTMNFETLLMESGIADVCDIPWSTSVKLKDHIDPFEHQLSGINLLCRYERAALYDQTGTGKTLPIQAYALYRAGEGHKVIALMPPSLLTQFYESFYETFDNVEDNVKIEIFKGTPAQRGKIVSRWETEGYPSIIMMTYNLFRGSKKGGGYAEDFKRRGYNVLIADEAQALRNSSSGIHKKVYNFIGGKKDEVGKFGLVLSTGTPSHTHLEQNYGLIRLVTPNAYGTKSAYERLHVIRNYGSPFNEIVGYDNYDVMTMNLYSKARRVEKKDVAKNLPPKIHTVVPVELDPAHKRLYKKLLDERVLELESGFIDAVQDQALRQIALRLVTCPNDFSDALIVNNMEATLVDLVESIDLERTKVIVFIHFNSTADRLMEVFEKYNPALMNGRVTNKDVQVKKFLHDESCRVLVAHPLSAGSGLNFQSICSSVVFYETPDSPGNVTQASDRVHRISGTTETVNIYFLSAKGTWAAKKIKQVRQKDEIINRVVGDKKALLSDLFDGQW